MVVFVTFQVDCYTGVTGTIYEYGALTLSDGDYIQFKQFAGKVVLFVNVATYCGLTAQYPGEAQSRRPRDCALQLGVF